MALVNDFYVVNTIEKEGSKIVGDIKINQDHRIFDGHFPGNPVVPGVCMIEIINELLGLANKKKYRLAEGSNVKFMNILNPAENPVVKVEHEILSDTGTSVKLKSSFYNQDKVFLKFSGTFTESPF
jgi:3-hydroxyacyl-[acyl-carrier-protein] dehydratase